jgi:hypothetical protein
LYDEPSGLQAVDALAEARGGFFRCYSAEAVAVIVDGVAADIAAADLAAVVAGLVALAVA